jgi:hypothetical protein
MDPIITSNVISIGKELLNKVSNSVNPPNSSDSIPFAKKLEDSQNSTSTKESSETRIQNLQKSFKSELLKDPATEKFFTQNKDNTIHLEKRADGSAQFISSNGQSLIIKKNSPHCIKANELIELCFTNSTNLTAMRPNAIVFNS